MNICFSLDPTSLLFVAFNDTICVLSHLAILHYTLKPAFNKRHSIFF